MLLLFSVEWDAQQWLQIREFLRGQVATSTTYGITTAHNFFKRNFESRGESREIADLPPMELNTLLALTFKDAIKLDGTPYEPSCLSTYFQGLSRHLIDCDYPVNVLSDDQFSLTRDVLAPKTAYKGGLWK